MKYVEQLDSNELKNAIENIIFDKDLAKKLIYNSFKKIKEINDRNDFNIFFK